MPGVKNPIVTKKFRDLIEFCSKFDKMAEYINTLQMTALLHRHYLMIPNMNYNPLTLCPIYKYRAKNW